MAQGLVFDVGDTGKAPEFAAECVLSTTLAMDLLISHRNSVMKQYPDIDCVFLNAGTQRFYDLTNLKDFDVKGFQHEINVNFMTELNGPVGMPLQQYVEETWNGLKSGSDQIVGGTLGDPKLFMDIVDNRRKIFEEYSNSWN
ncbi:unnamed protein product [Penicillium crustosum]